LLQVKKSKQPRVALALAVAQKTTANDSHRLDAIGETDHKTKDIFS